MASEKFRILNEQRNTVLAEACDKAGFGRRGVGLMGRASLPPSGGLIIQPCSGVVSFFMRFTIDVLFMDKDDRVLYVLHKMKPWRVSRIVRGSKFVIELPAGKAEESRTDVGDQLTIRQVDS